MTDFILHFTSSFLLVILMMGFTKNLPVSVIIVLIVGISKEIFMDVSISELDLIADVIGVLVAANALKGGR